MPIASFCAVYAQNMLYDSVSRKETKSIFCITLTNSHGSISILASNNANVLGND